MAMVPKEFLMFITVYSVVVAGSELLGHQSTCHFQIIYCSCKEMYGVDLTVTVEKCIYDVKEGDAKSVCSRETVMEKCSKGELSKFLFVEGGIYFPVIFRLYGHRGGHRMSP